jgi:hypothetical protein
MRYHQAFRITGVANTITYDSGLKSSETEPKRLVNVHVQMDKYAGTDDNEFQGWHERAKVFDFPEKLIPSEAVAVTASDVSEPRSKVIPVDIDIPVGEVFKASISCAATAVDVRGVYEYELI